MVSHLQLLKDLVSEEKLRTIVRATEKLEAEANDKVQTLTLCCKWLFFLCCCDKVK